MFVDVGAVYDGVVANIESLCTALADLSRDDTLVYCAKLNALITGYNPKLSPSERQGIVLRMLCTPDELGRISAFASASGIERVTVLFRGGLLELARHVTIHCTNHEGGDGEPFLQANVRSTLVRAALIANGLWSQRLYGTRLLDEGPLDLQLRRALGAFRKGVEESNPAPHPGVALGRGWLLFSEFLKRRLPSFDARFQAATGLTLQQYYVCAAALMKFTFAGETTGPHFRTDYVASDTAFADTFAIFIDLHSQSPESLAAALEHEGPEAGYKAIREKPIISFLRGHSVILDPTIYTENLTISPLFFALRNASKAIGNEIFGAFGLAFEDYAIDLLEQMFPAGEGVLARRLLCRLRGQNAAGQEFEVDAILNDVTTALVFEMKASWVREDKVLADDHEVFLKELRSKYGFVPGSEERPKGVAQLAKIVNALARREWTGDHDELRLVTEIIPVLTVHDERMAAAGSGNFLDQEFHQLLGHFPDGCRIHRLIVMTIVDLENLSSSVERFGLMEFLRAYSLSDSDRMSSVHNLMAMSEYSQNIVASGKLIAASRGLMEVAKSLLYPKA